MSKIYVAFMPTGSRVASGSIITLKEKVRIYPDTQWAVYLYDVKGNVETLITMMEGDISKLPAPQQIEHWKITASGRISKFDPTKAITP